MILSNIEFESEKSKSSDDYLTSQTDLTIAELVYPKVHIQKFYNYYHGIRDPEQFRYLEENYGLGNPTSVRFTPLVKKHIDSLIGEYLDIPLLPKVSCKDKKTLSNISRDKQLKIFEEVMKHFSERLNNGIISILTGQTNQDPAIQKNIEDLISNLENNFLSDYEIAAQNVVNYILQNREIDFQNKLQTMLLDLLIAGMTYYRVRPSRSGENIEIEVLNPLQVFTEYNPESLYRKNDYRSVVVKGMSVSEILHKYGEHLDDDELEKLRGCLNEYIKNGNTYYVRSYTSNPTGYPSIPGLVSNIGTTPGSPHSMNNYYYNNSSRMIPVYEIEWITTNKHDNKYIMDRYETVRIGGDIYLLTGKSENIIRTQDNPGYCGLSINGIYYQNRNAEPYSLMAATMDLQDQYDILMFYRDNLIASSGTVGDWIDVSQLPEFLGSDIQERVQKFIAYKKNGQALIDTSQEGRMYNANTIFSGFDDTLKAQAIQAFDLAIQRTEETCSSITGVFRERLNGIQQKDAVSNIAVGQKNSFTITKQYYSQMDYLVRGMLIDSLDIAKIVYKKGLTGTIILGDKSQKIFTALPKHFTLTDFDIHIPASTEVLQEIQKIEAYTIELIKSGLISPDVLMEVVTSRSLTELKINVNKALKKQKEDVGQLQQLTQQNEQLQNQLKELSQQLQQANQKVQQLDERRLQIESDKIQFENEREWYKIRQDANYQNRTVDVKSKQVDAELVQLYDNNPRNNEIKNT